MFQRWMIKAAIQSAIARLPRSSDLNYLMQKYVSRSLRRKDTNFRTRMNWTAAHLNNFSKYTGQKLPSRVLELGTGWFPTVPIALYLCGVDEIYTIDIHDLTKADYFAEMVQALVAFPEQEIKQLLPQLQPDRLQRFKTEIAAVKNIDQVRQMMNIRPMIGDARKMTFPDKHFDLIISNTTLEHIPADVIAGILGEFRRVLSPNGIMSHYVDMSDHYQHSDKSITRYNYLRYDDQTWKRFNNDVLFQNRLRYPDYARIHQAAGFRVLEMQLGQGYLEQLQAITVAEQFKHYTQEELLPIHVWIVSAPTPSNI